MPTECNPALFEFPPVEGRRVVASFDGGAITSDAGALLLGQTDRAIRLTERFAACFADTRAAELVEHQVETMVMQRVVGIALGYEDLNDHDELRHDPVLAVLAGKLEAQRSDCAPLAGKSTLNRLELSRAEPTRYHKISHDPAAIESLFVDLFLDAHKKAPKQIILDLDATDDPLHGNQEGRFFHGYYDCYCYLPLYIFCGRHLLAAKLRRSNIDAAAGAVEEVARIVAQIRRRWPRTRILLRGDSGFTREPLMAWCEANRVDYVFGLARNDRLEKAIVAELITATIESIRTGKTARCFKDFSYATLSTLEPRTPRHRQGRGDRRRGQSALRRHLAQAQRGRRAAPLREDLLRARRHGEPHQGMPARPVRRPHLDRNHASQPAPPVVCLDGLRAALRLAPHRPGAHAVRRGHLRHDPAETAEARRTGPGQRAADQGRDGIGLPVAGRVRARACPTAPRHRLIRTRQRTDAIQPRQRRRDRGDGGALPGPGTASWKFFFCFSKIFRLRATGRIYKHQSKPDQRLAHQAVAHRNLVRLAQPAR